MNLSATESLLWTQRLAGAAVFFQTLEFFLLQKNFETLGIWNWSTLRKDFATFPKPLPWFFSLVLDQPGFRILLGLRLLSSLAILHWPHPFFFFFLALGHLLTCARFRGTFNGGSDAITQAVLNALFVASLGAYFWPEKPEIIQGALTYIALQSMLSYFIAGLVKIKVPEWRSGRALSLFLTHPSYEIADLGKKISAHRGLCWTLSWSVMLFECLFPWALFDPGVCKILVGIAFGFHLSNAYLFGLNRFLFAWCATYPALLFFSGFY